MSLLTLFQNVLSVQAVTYVANSRFYAPYVGYASQLPAKDPDETWVLTLDATAALAPGETLTKITLAESIIMVGTDANAAAVLSTSPAPQINPATITLSNSVSIGAANAVLCEIAGGLSGCKYQITIVVKTSNPFKTLALKCVIPVSSN